MDFTLCVVGHRHQGHGKHIFFCYSELGSVKETDSEDVFSEGLGNAVFFWLKGYGLSCANSGTYNDDSNDVF